MMDPRLPFDEGRAFHFMMGRPDDDCEICRAHGLIGHGTEDDDELSLIITEIRSLSDLLDCPCPLCTQMIRNSPAAGRRRPRGETP